jgi:hypothetical protein
MAQTLDDLIAKGTLVPLKPRPGLRQYHIPGLKHLTMTLAGRQTITYLLTVEPAKPRYTVEAHSDQSGPEVVFESADFDELERWIGERLGEQG